LRPLALFHEGECAGNVRHENTAVGLPPSAVFQNFRIVRLDAAYHHIAACSEIVCWSAAV
jgi:hypothetical protein